MTESLASLHLDAADNDVITWAFDATTYQQDMLAVLGGRDTPAARAQAQAALGPALAALNARAGHHRRHLERGQEVHRRRPPRCPT